jgi:PKD repeat protein
MLLFFLIVPSAATMIQLSTEELVNSSDAIIIGDVRDIESYWAENDTIILTSTTIAVDSILKGNVSENLTITTRGGTVGDMCLWVEDEPVFVSGYTYGLFLKNQTNNTYAINGKYQGVRLVCSESLTRSAKRQVSCTPADEFSKEVYSALQGEYYEPVRESLFVIGDLTAKQASKSDQPVIYSVSPTSASAGTGETITIYGKGFGTKSSRGSNADVAFTFNDYYWIWASGFFPYDNWQTVNENSIVEWTDTKIVTKVPVGRAFDGSTFYPGGASSGPLMVLTDDERFSDYSPFAVSFSYGTGRWESPVVPLTIVSNDYSTVPIIESAANTWNSVPNTDFQFRFVSYENGERQPQRNSKNEIVWGITEDPRNIAEAWTWYSSQNRYPHGNILEADIVFNKYCDWGINYPEANQYDFQTTALHELGHWVGLNDLYGNIPGYPSDTHKTMYGIGAPGEIKRTLSTEDIAGIQHIYPGSIPTTIPTTTPTTIPTTTSTVTPTVTVSPTDTLSPLQADFTASLTSGQAPLIVQFQDSSQGDPTGWIWDVNGDGFRDYSEKIVEHTYTSPGLYSVTLTVSRYQEKDAVTKSDYVFVTSATPTTAIPTTTQTTMQTTSPTPTISPTSTPAGDMTLNLQPGWNFISVPKRLEVGHNTVGALFSNVDTGMRSIFLYDAEDKRWRTLTESDVVKPLDGIWIYSENPEQIALTFKGVGIELPPTKLLYQGWNAIGFSDTTPASARLTLLSVDAPPMKVWSQLFGFNSDSQSYESAIFNADPSYNSLMHPTRGYWLYMNGQNPPWEIAAISA